VELSAELLTGAVIHQRSRPRKNNFVYKVFFLRLRLSAIESAANRLFSLNRFNLASFHFRDHGARDGTHPLTWIRSVLAREGLQDADGEVFLHCFPRILGYVFNPVSFWFCHDRDGRLRAVLAEVNNTFHEHHAYLLANPDARPIMDNEDLHVRKSFHVSPFLPVAGNYRFRFRTTDPRFSGIDYCDDEGPLLRTCISGRSAPLTTRTLLLAWITHPLMTVGVMARIHWQALRLRLKQVPFFSKPAPPRAEISR